jgi:SAM-dependent methyltransferase
MCLHNHLVSRHKQGADYLKRVGWGSWTIVHDNLHNDRSFKGEGGTRRYIGSRITAPKEPSAFAPTPLGVCEKMLDVSVIDSSDVVYDLGCGDGRLLVLAALKYNCKAVGVDIDPECVRRSNENIQRYGVQHLARAYQEDVRETDFREASVVTLYLMPSLLTEIESQLRSLSAGSRVVAYDKPIPGWAPEGQLQEGRHSIYVWVTKEKRSKPKCRT